MTLNSMAISGILCVTALFAGCGPNRVAHSGTPTASNSRATARADVKDSAGHMLRLGDEVMLTKMGYGCKSRNMLARAIEEQNLGKFLALKIDISNFPECITQGEFPHQHWTVTAVHPPLVQIGPVTAVEVKSFKNTASGLSNPNPQNYKNRYWIPPQWLLKIRSR